MCDVPHHKAAAFKLLKHRCTFRGGLQAMYRKKSSWQVKESDVSTAMLKVYIYVKMLFSQVIIWHVHRISFLPKALFGFLHGCKTYRMKHASSFLTLFFISASRYAVPDWEHMELPVSSQCLQWPVWVGYDQVGKAAWVVSMEHYSPH